MASAGRDRQPQRPERQNQTRAAAASRRTAGVSQAPSNWIVIGRYVCDPSIFGVLSETPAGRGGEIQLTDALRTLALTDRDSPSDGGGVHGLLFRGRRYDTGNKQDFLRTTVEFACARPDLAPEFIPWLRDYLETLP